MNCKMKRKLINNTKSQSFEIIKLCFTEYSFQELLINALWGEKLLRQKCLKNTKPST